MEPAARAASGFFVPCHSRGWQQSDRCGSGVLRSDHPLLYACRPARLRGLGLGQALINEASAGPGLATGRWSWCPARSTTPGIRLCSAAPYDLDWPGFIQRSGCNSSSAAGRADRCPKALLPCVGSTLGFPCFQGINGAIHARSACLYDLADRTASCRAEPRLSRDEAWTVMRTS